MYDHLRTYGFARECALVLLVLALSAAGLLLLASLLPLAAGAHFFSEEGMVERITEACWVFTGLVILRQLPPSSVMTWVLALLCFFCAAREADLHKAFTADSMLKMNYYRRTVAPFAEKFLAGAVALGVVALAGLALASLFRFVRRGGWRLRHGVWLLAALALMVLTKVFDRLPATLQVDYNLVISQWAQLHLLALEEGLESVAPLMLAWSAWLSRRHPGTQPLAQPKL
jgi:hypothetical protein